MSDATNNPRSTTDHAVLESIRAIKARYGADRLDDLKLVDNGDAGLLVRRPAWLDDDQLWNHHEATLTLWWNAIVRAELARWQEANR